MEVAEFDFTYKYQGIEMTASCQKFQVLKCPQYRVVINNGKKRPFIYTFYEVGEPGKMFFWFDHNTGRESLHKAIAKALEKQQTEDN